MLTVDVPFREKDEAKSLGAMWDYRARVWFIPDDADVTLFTRWRILRMTEDEAKDREEKWRRERPYTGPREIVGKWRTGNDYRPACDRCGIPPWEDCDCSFA